MHKIIITNHGTQNTEHDYMSKIKNHKDLDIWILSMDLVTKVYVLTSDYPSTEKFGLIAQMRRAAVSIPSNIAEGFARQTTKELIQFLYISNGSLSELETQLLISKNLNFVKDIESFEDIIIRIRKMISKLISKLKEK